MIYTDGTHLITDALDLDELHTFAQAIGLKRRWFQNKPGRPHYDTLTQSKKSFALAAGAKKVSSKEIVQILTKRQEEGVDHGGE